MLDAGQNCVEHHFELIDLIRISLHLRHAKDGLNFCNFGLALHFPGQYLRCLLQQVAINRTNFRAIGLEKAIQGLLLSRA